MESFDPTTLLPLDWQLTESWRQAAAELGVRVTAPFELPVGGQVFRFAALVTGFGTPAGVLLRAMLAEPHPEATGPIWSEALDAGYLPVNVCPRFCRVDRDEFLKFLKSFEWRGLEDEQPFWHDGAPIEDQWDQWLAGLDDSPDSSVT